jgi:hypothetical protein
VYAIGGGSAFVATHNNAADLSAEAVNRIVRLVGNQAAPVAPSARTFSVEELAALSELAGSPSFPGTGEYVLPDDAARLAARRALVASGSLREVDPQGRPQVDEASAQLVSTALSPAALIRVERRDDGGTAQLNVYIGSDRSVLHRASPDGIHRLEPVPSEAVGSAVRRFARLRDGAQPAANGFQVPQDTFSRLQEMKDQGRLDPEAEEGDARLLARLLADVAVSCRVELVSAGDDGQSSEMTWIDCGQEGLWVLDEAGENVAFEPMGLEDLSRRFEALSRPTT